MKTSITFICFLVQLLILTPNTKAQWNKTNGPFGGGVISLAVDGDYIFAGTHEGVFLSTNNGSSWNAVNDGLPGARITTLSIYDNDLGGKNIIAGSDGKSIFLSTNYGANWTSVSNGINPNWHVLSSTVSADVQGRQNIFVAGWGGICRSTDNGTSWEIIKKDDNFYTSLAIAPNGNIFAGTQNNGIFLSTDNGVEWNLVNNGLSSLIISSLLILPTDQGGNYIFAGTGSQFSLEGNGVFLSTDDGSSWTNVNNGLTNLDVTSLASKPNGLGGNIIYAGTVKFEGGGIFSSTNNGSNWVEVTNGITDPMISTIDIATNGNIIVGTGYVRGGGAFLSTDNGSSWHSINNGLSATKVWSLAISSNGTNIFAGTNGNGIFLSTNNGSSWTSLNNGLPYRGGVRTLAIDSNDAVYAGIDAYGVYRSSNNGVNWISVNNGLTNLFITELAINGNNIFVGTVYGGIFISTNNGSNWSASNTGLTSTIVQCFAIGQNEIYAGTHHDGSGNGGVFISTNNGANWTAINNGLKVDKFGNIEVNEIIAYPNGIGGHNLLANILADDGVSIHVFLSTNNGSNWNEVTSGLSSKLSYKYFASQQNGPDSNYVFMGSSLKDFYRSINFGEGWIPINNDNSITNYDAHTNSLAIGTDFIFMGTEASGVWRRPLSEIMKLTPIISISNASLNFGELPLGQSKKDSILISNSGDYTLKISVDSSYNNSVFSITPLSLIIKPMESSYLFITYTPNDESSQSDTILIYHNAQNSPLSLTLTGNGKIVGVVESEKIPMEYVLKQNYPNPFNPTTKINYSIPYPSFVSLKIYDLLGKEMQTLVYEEKSIGKYEVEFDGSNFSSGIYFYRIQAGDFSDTKKLTILR